jgi:excisionase family DNA binding protein
MSTPDKNKALLKPAEVAQLFRCSRASIYKLIAAKQLPHVRFEVKGARTRPILRVYERDAVEFLERHYQSNN